MRLVPETLQRELARGTPPFVLIHGDEPLLVGEAADAVRARAKKDGYAAREVVFVERGYDWSALLAETRAMSLFAERRVLELRMPSPKPGAEGSKALAEMLRGEPPQDLLVMLITGRLEDRAAAWVKAFDEHGLIVEAEQIAPENLPAWLVERLARVQLEADDDAVQLLAERCEGNLVAAHQEIERLALLIGAGRRLDLATVEDAVANSARYNVFQLAEAALAGDPGRYARVLDGLAAEGEEPTLVLWCLAEDLRALMQWSPQPARGAHVRMFRGGRRRQTLLAQAAKRVPRPRLRELLLEAAHADAVIKGARAGNPWSELLRIGSALAGAPLPARPARA